MAEQDDELNESLSGEDVTRENAATGEARSKWYKRLRKGITTSTAEKREMPEGLWSKCPECHYICTTSELKENMYVCPKCNYHHRIGSEDYFEILFNEKRYTELFENIKSNARVSPVNKVPTARR